LLFLEVLVVFIKLLVINNHLTLRVGAGIEWVLSSLFLDITDDVFQRSIFTVVHFVIFSKFHDYWPWDSLGCLLQVKGLENLSESSFSQRLGNMPTFLKYSIRNFVDDFHLAVFLE